MRIDNHPAVIAWQRLVGTPSIPGSVEPVKRMFRKRRKEGQPVVYRMTGLKEFSFPVIAKRCNPVAASNEVAVYSEILPQLSIPSPEFLGVACGEVESLRWLFLEDVLGKSYQPSVERHRELVGKYLGLLHASACIAACSSSLEKYDYLYDTGPDRIFRYLDIIRHIISQVSTNPNLHRDDLALLDTVLSQCEEVEAGWKGMHDFCSAQTRTLVHGDLGVSNMRIKDQGRSLVLFDWERCGFGIPALDLCQFLSDKIDPDIRSYLSTVRRYDPRIDIKTIRRLAYIGEVFRWLDATRWEVEKLNWEWVQEPIRRLKSYILWMDQIKIARPWCDNAALAEGDWNSYIPSD